MSDWRDIESLFEEAVALAPPEREAFVQRRSPSDAVRDLSKISRS